MGPERISAKRTVWGALCLSFALLWAHSGYTQSLPLPESLPAVSPKPEILGPYTLVRQKVFPNDKVEVLQRSTLGKFPRIESTRVRIVPNDGTAATEIKGTWMTPDPKVFAPTWSGGPIDLDGDGLEDLVLQNYSAGVHCCYNYPLFSLAKPLKKLGNLAMKDCGATIRLEDLNGDKKLEIISCNPDFIYLDKIPFSDSPFPPAIYVLREGGYKRADKEFRQVFLKDIEAQRAELANGYSPAAALQIVADYLILGDDAQAGKEFDALYQGEDKAEMRREIWKRAGRKPEGAVPGAESRPAGPATKTDAW